MATQGQRRREAVNAVRKLRQEYRKADSAGEVVERSLDRLTKRKTLIGPDDLASLANQVDAFVRLVESLQKAYALLYEIIKGLPR